MNILLLSASPNKEKGNTFRLAQGVLEGCAGREDVRTEVVQLADCDIGFCRSLERCHEKAMDCPIRDDVPGILRKMLAADGIVLATPNYIDHVAASLKALFDRSSHFIHCRRLLGKYVAAAVSSGSGVDRKVLAYLKHYCLVCGAQFTGGVSSAARSVEEKGPEAVRLGRKLVSDIRKKKIYPRQAAAIEESEKRFAAIIRARKDEWKDEYRYWSEKGWL
ncbi:MAG: NAD(P)H-dependent oxidoreductase [Planctomycetota bacterium]